MEDTTESRRQLASELIGRLTISREPAPGLGMDVVGADAPTDAPLELHPVPSLLVMDDDNY
jgi:hypothetical protein